MPDIAMCMGNNCPLKKRCYRYRAKPNPFWQSYFGDTPYKDNECDRFWSIEEYPEKYLKPLEDDK